MTMQPCAIEWRDADDERHGCTRVNSEHKTEIISEARWGITE